MLIGGSCGASRAYAGIIVLALGCLSGAWFPSFQSTTPQNTPVVIRGQSSANATSSAFASSLTAAPALESGFVNKSGPAPFQHWMPSYDLARLEQFHTWERDTAIHPNGSLAASWQGEVRLPNLPPLYPHCMVYVNHRYKFIYVRHPKSASSSVTQFFKACGNPRLKGAVDVRWRGSRAGAAHPHTVAAPQQGQRADQQQRGQRENTTSNAAHTAVQRLGVGAACLQRQGVFGAGLTAEDARAMWSDYFVFSVVRNPYARALSAYKFLLHKMRSDPGCPSVRWDAFCADPLSLGRACKRQPRCCPLSPGYAWHHVIDQGRCVTTEGGGWAVDYLVSLETFDQQMREVVAEIDRRRDPRLPPLANVTDKLTWQNKGKGGGEGGEDSSGSAERAGGEGRRPLLDHQPAEAQVLGIPYNASVLLDRHCDPDDYYRGEHAHCLAQVRHFYHTDFQRMYAPHDMQMA